MTTEKKCRICGELKPLSAFGKHKHSKDKLSYDCTDCRVIKNRESQHRNGHARSYETAKDCNLYLGVHVAERLLSHIFSNVERSKINNPGYDFICGKGYKIDSKSACITHTQKYDVWGFHINKNNIADYFACIGFDNREQLTPLKFWLIPGELLRNKKMLTIKTEYKTVVSNPYSLYEHPIGKLQACCNIMKGEV